MAAADAASFERLKRITKQLGNQEIILNGRAVSIEGVDYGGAVERLHLLTMLNELCAEVGVTVTHHDDIRDPRSLEDADLVIGADGANSTLRAAYSAEFRTHGSELSNAFSWYGAERIHDRPTLSFRSAGGGAFCAHYYPYTDRMCTFVMECDRAAWEGCGFGTMTNDERKLFVEQLFGDDLKSQPLISNKSEWRNFQPVWNDKWVHGHRVLIGDAVRRAHFSIGSGTRIAMEDSIALVNALQETSEIETALLANVANRKPAADILIDAARESYTWYEEMGRHMAEAKGPNAFAYGYLTRTSRVNADRVAGDYPKFMKAYEAELEGVAS
ncbi:MAG: FAD-dependent monooxygenase [Rhizobiaceae bacterium]